CGTAFSGESVTATNHKANSGPADERHPMFSPDGRWIAYASNEYGDSQIYVRAFPGTASRWQISMEGGLYPIWSRDGRQLFFRTQIIRSWFPTAVRMVIRSSEAVRGFDAGAAGKHWTTLELLSCSGWEADSRYRAGIGC